MITTNILSDSASKHSGLRPVNLRTDLAPLADLIELVFSDSMDSNGRAAIREMRYMSRLGPGLELIGRLNDLAAGISMGYVWIEDERLVGNVSVYPANWPESLGSAWIIANVGVHPDYQRRGIARQLMEASLTMIRERKGQHAILQVNYDNQGAIRLYEQMHFIRERAFTTWWRSPLSTPVPPFDHDLYITRRRSSEWQAEYQLANRVRPNQQGGIAWLKPTHPGAFRTTFLQGVQNFFSMSHKERLIIRTADQQGIAAALWIETGLATSRNRLTLLVDPAAAQPHGEALLNTAVQRYRSQPLVIEHPVDDEMTNAVLRRYRFIPNRTVWHMRLPIV